MVRGAIEHLCRLLDEGDIPTEEVVLEVTEEAVQGGDLLAVLNRARSLGMRVALDDFGSGHSSLGRLRDLPVDLIKIDRSLVRGVDLDRHARQILRSIEQMATQLDIECVVEGVESAAEAGGGGRAGLPVFAGLSPRARHAGTRPGGTGAARVADDGNRDDRLRGGDAIGICARPSRIGR